MKTAGWLFALMLFVRVWGYASCERHGGPSGCDHASNTVLCADGALDKRFRCTGPRNSSRHPKTRVLKMKPPNTTRGQILNPGETPPPTTLKDSK